MSDSHVSVQGLLQHQNGSNLSPVASLMQQQQQQQPHQERQSSNDSAGNVNGNGSVTGGANPNPNPTSAHGTPRSHGGTASLYQCADCQRRYSRPEHLARHIQTHTLGKRFFCPECNKAFARADLLKRHAANHSSDASGKKRKRLGGESPNAGRVSHACRACAAARVKCEELKPCTRCRNRNVTCEYGGDGAGSTAAMHLLHLSAHAITNPGAEESGGRGQVGGHQQGSYETLQSPSIMQGHMAGHDSQLAPASVVPHSNPNVFVPNFNNSNQVVDPASLPFSDFLSNVMTLQPYDPNRLDESQGLSVLNFCDDTNLEMNDLDFGLLGYYNTGEMMNEYYPDNTASQMPRPEDSVDMSEMRQRLAQIWTKSPWRWTPDKLDHAYSEQHNLPVPSKDMTSSSFQASRRTVDQAIPDRLEAISRDKLLATVLSTCQQASTMRRIASSFPSVDVLDTLIDIFMASHLCQSSSWIHTGSLKLNSQFPEWIASILAAGAVLTPVPTLRKFGFALQEAVRLAIISRWEEDNSFTRDLGMLQSFVLHLDVGIWSGNRRKMEIATSHGQAPIIMLRAAGRFKRSSFFPSTVTMQDEGQVLEEKWKQWAAAESYKRLCFHLFLRDAETSMTTLVNPILSYAEITLPLPAPKELWFAKSAMEWKTLYLSRMASNSDSIPSLLDILRDSSILAIHQSHIDLQFSASIYLHAIWGMIFEHRQLDSIHRLTISSTHPSNTSLVLSSRHQDLSQTLYQFQLLLSDWSAAGLLSVQEPLLLNHMLMFLNLSLDDLQLFAGKDGEDNARRVYPTLQLWAASREARQALWHAGQVLRFAKMFPPNHLKDFYAVAVHHASLALWVYGVVTKANTRSAQNMGMLPLQNNINNNDIIWLDGQESLESQRFVLTGKGRPSIHGPGEKMAAGVEDSRSAMELCHEVLKSNFAGEGDTVPPIVENLCVLIKQLGNAAWAVGLG